MQTNPSSSVFVRFVRSLLLLLLPALPTHAGLTNMPSPNRLAIMVNSTNFTVVAPTNAIIGKWAGDGSGLSNITATAVITNLAADILALFPGLDTNETDDLLHDGSRPITGTLTGTNIYIDSSGVLELYSLNGTTFKDWGTNTAIRMEAPLIESYADNTNKVYGPDAADLYTDYAALLLAEHFLLYAQTTGLVQSTLGMLIRNLSGQLIIDSPEIDIWPAVGGTVFIDGNLDLMGHTLTNVGPATVYFQDGTTFSAEDARRAQAAITNDQPQSVTAAMLANDIDLTGHTVAVDANTLQVGGTNVVHWHESDDFNGTNHAIWFVSTNGSRIGFIITP